MTLYDVIHLEDYPPIRYLMKYCLMDYELEYLGVGSLEEFEEALEKYEAKIFVVDGNFPIKKGGNKFELNYRKAIEAIENKYSDSEIIIYSNTEVKDTCGYEFIDKKVLPDELAEKINDMLS